VDGADAYLNPYAPKGGWLEERFVRCGKDCRCKQGQPHGTYWRLCWREGKQRKQRYVAAADVEHFQHALELRRLRTRHRRRQKRAVAAELRRARELVQRMPSLSPQQTAFKVPQTLYKAARGR
jgi:hypothetical protein